MPSRTITHIVAVVAGIDGALLKWAREEAGWGRQAFAQEHGISLQYLCDIEEGRRHLKRNPGLIGRFAKTLGMPTGRLAQRESA